MKTVEMIVTADGEVTIRAVGYKGQSCKKATKALEDAMGITAKSTPTPEFYQQEQTCQKLGGT